jgi:hypothetical protein
VLKAMLEILYEIRTIIRKMLNTSALTNERITQVENKLTTLETSLNNQIENKINDKNLLTPNTSK